MKNNVFLLFMLISFHSMAIAQNIPDHENEKINQVDEKGLKQGLWEKYYPNGKLQYKGYFKNNKPVGELKRYFENGNLKVEMNFAEDNDTVHAKFFYNNGKTAATGCYSGTVKAGEWKYFSEYDGALISSEVFKNGKLNGKSVIYYPSGNISEELFFADNKKHGPWKQYYEDGSNKMECNYDKDILDGTYYIYYPSGNIQVMGLYKDNLMNGYWTYLTDKGEKKLELKYNNGIPENQEELVEKEQEFFRMIDENKGKLSEPDASEFVPHMGY